MTEKLSGSTPTKEGYYWAHIVRGDIRDLTVVHVFVEHEAMSDKDDQVPGVRVFGEKTFYRLNNFSWGNEVK